MRDIAQALGHLPDDEARKRVWEWAGEHFLSVAASPRSGEQNDPDPPAKSSGRKNDDLSLTVDDDLFDLADGAVEPLLDDNDLPADESDETVHCEPNDDGAEVARDAREAGGLEAMLRDFAADFRRLALAWQMA